MGQRARLETFALFIVGVVCLPGRTSGTVIVDDRVGCVSPAVRTADKHCCPRNDSWSPSCSCCRSLPALALACESRRALEECIEAGEMYAYGVNRNSKRAAAMFEKACRYGSAIGCVKLAPYYEGGIGRREDPARADVLYAKACAGGVSCACLVVGVDLSDPSRSERDARRGTAMLARVCEMDDMLACRWLARRYREGSGVARDPEKAEGLLAKACAAKSRDACDGVDPVNRRELVRRDCGVR